MSNCAWHTKERQVALSTTVEKSLTVAATLSGWTRRVVALKRHRKSPVHRWFPVRRVSVPPRQLRLAQGAGPGLSSQGIGDRVEGCWRWPGHMEHRHRGSRVPRDQQMVLRTEVNVLQACENSAVPITGGHFRHRCSCGRVFPQLMRGRSDRAAGEHLTALEGRRDRRGVCPIPQVITDVPVPALTKYHSANPLRQGRHV
jgi:hypothetical protein